MYNANCQICSSNDVCVFNLADQKCVPGDKNGDLCRSTSQYITMVNQCNNSLSSSSLFDNIDNLNGAKVKSIKVQTRKKLGATGPWWSEMDEAGKTRVVNGSFTNLSPEDYNVREPI